MRKSAGVKAAAEENARGEAAADEERKAEKDGGVSFVNPYGDVPALVSVFREPPAGGVPARELHEPPSGACSGPRSVL